MIQCGVCWILLNLNTVSQQKPDVCQVRRQTLEPNLLFSCYWNCLIKAWEDAFEMGRCGIEKKASPANIPTTLRRVFLIKLVSVESSSLLHYRLYL